MSEFEEIVQAVATVEWFEVSVEIQTITFPRMNWEGMRIGGWGVTRAPYGKWVFEYWEHGDLVGRPTVVDGPATLAEALAIVVEVLDKKKWA